MSATRIIDDHVELANIGSLSHTTIDSYLDQAVKVASSPQFANLGIGIAAESGKVKVLNKAVLFDGVTGATPISGAGTRLMWIPAKSAFRVGKVTGYQWDDANIGIGSFSFGYDGKASSTWSTHFGSGGDITGLAGTHFGYKGTASGDYSIHFGYEGIASGGYSTHFGAFGIPGGSYSIHFGYKGTADGVVATHFGYEGTADGIVATHFGYKGTASGDYSWVGGRYMQLTSAADYTFVYGYSNTAVSIATPNAFLIFPEGTLGNLGLGTKVFGTASNAVFGIGNGVAPTSSPANMVQLYAEDVGGSSELKVRDEAGNVTVLSPHDFSLFPKPDNMAWSYHSKNPYIGKEINVDMWSAIREIEKMSGKKFIYDANIERENKAEQEAEVEIQKLMQKPVEVTKDEAIEIATPMEGETKKRYIFDPHTGETECREPVTRDLPETYQIKKHYWLDKDTGKFYRRKTREEALKK